MKIRQNIHPAHVSALSALVGDIASGGVPAQAVEIYQGRNVVAAFDGPEGCRLNIKAFRRPNAINRFAYGVLRHGKARRAYDNALRLLEAGLSTPQPLAWIECRTCAGALLSESYFLSEQLDGREDIRRCAGMADFDAIARGIAAVMLRPHRAGIWMKDFTPGNILWQRLPDGTYDFALVDINRMAFGVRSHRRLMSNFGRLFPDDDAATERVARHYASLAGLDAGHVAEDARRAIADAHRRLQRKNILKKLFKHKRK